MKNQTEECAMKRVFGFIILYDNVVGKWLLNFSYILIVVLLQELIVFPYRLQVYCTSMG